MKSVRIALIVCLVAAAAWLAQAAAVERAAAGTRADPPFQGSVYVIGATLKAKMLASGSWTPACPVTLSNLRLIKVSYWGFDGKVHLGNLVVNRYWAYKLVGVFRQMYTAHFRIRSIRVIDAYGASDRLSMAADNTSGYNGRYVSGTHRWSLHAYGCAIDINPVENPWVSGSQVSPPAGLKYVDRSHYWQGMIHGGDAVVRAFRSIGWKWGGYWYGTKDYMHFSSTGG